MEDIIVGVNLPDGTGIMELKEELGRIEKDGFNGVEINLAAFPFIIGCEIKEEVVEYVKNILDQYNLKYTAHIGYGLDLRNIERYDIHKKILFLSIDLCEQLGMSPLNLHYEEESKSIERENAFYNAHREAAEYALKKGIELNIENIEIEYTEKVVDFVKKVNHSNLGMTLDIGHLFISANYFGYDYLETVKECAPLVRHIHVNDNTGDFEKMRLENFDLYRTMSMEYRITFGAGDIHVPPFWGKVPMLETFKILKESGYKGVWVCEYYSKLFRPFNKSIQEKVRREIQ